MSGPQRWVTSAENDTEAWKCLLLGRSLKKSLTTRFLHVICSHQVSTEIMLRLEKEFDFCQQLGKPDPKKLQETPICSVADNVMKIRTKFVFVNCNCIILKNADELFHKNEMVQRVGQGLVAMAIVASEKQRKLDNLNPMSKKLSEKKNEIFPDKYEYFHDINLQLENCLPLDGKNIKMVNLSNGHPIEMVLPNKKDVFGQYIYEICQTLCPEIFMKETYKPIHFSSKLTNSVAIVGMAFRLPGANNIDEFWNILEAGQEGICKIPEDRWTQEKSFNCLDQVKRTEAGFLSCPIENFDSQFFNTNKTDLVYMDPQQRLMLQLVWESLENAGIDPYTLKNTLTGVFGGWWRNDYKEMLQQVGLNENEFFRTYMGNAIGTLTARISHFFELVGPSISTESGCSTSIVGVDMACDSLRNESCNVAFAVGANLFLHPFSTNLLDGVISPNGRCKTFDSEADGFGRAEGMAVLVLKRYSDAVANGDKIWGLIRGSAVVQEGPSKMMGTPTVECEALAMTLALERADVHPNEVSYLETHGTGTPVGDPLEVAAVTKAYSTKGRTDLLTIGSVKTNIGHTESVSGLAGIIKTLLSMKNELIPPHLNLKTLNPDINLSAIPAQIPIQAIDWKKSKNKPRIAGVSSFGITGTDAHVIIQETPDLDFSTFSSVSDVLPMKLFTLSGKSEESLMKQIKMYFTFLNETKCSLKDIEYTMHVGRAHLPFRHTIVGENLQEINDALNEEISPKTFKPISTPESKICFLFTGQGSQYSGMAQSLYGSNIVFASHFDFCDSILLNEYGFSIKEAIWGEDEKQLKRSLYSQTSIFVVEYCLLKLWESWGITPNLVVGHSLGEFAACIAAGMLTLEDALKLVVTRSKLIDVLPNAKMLVVREDLNTVETSLKKAFLNSKLWLDIAAINTSDQTVLAGSTEAVQLFAKYCENNKIKTHILDSSHAFHSRFMDPMLKEYEKMAKEINYKEGNMNCTFVSGVEGKVVKKVDAQYFVKHTREKVQFMDASQTILDQLGVTRFLEIGPHPVLSAMILTNSDNVDLDQPLVCCASLRKNVENWKTILNSLGILYELGFQVKWENFHRYSNANKVDIPGYCFDTNPCWFPIPNNGSVPFHPLLGTNIQNPSDTKIFKNKINIANVQFLRDHCLGDKIIFPGAAYMEMSLTAAYCAVHCLENSKFMKPTVPISIQNFFIESPICLNEKIPTECQTIVNKLDTGESRVSIFSKILLDETNFKWVQHTSTTFCPTALDMEQELWKTIVERCCEELTTEFDYSKLEDYGFKFGPCFKNLKKAWKTKQKDSEEILFGFSTSNLNLGNYLLHPCLIDSMFQAQIIGIGKHFQKPDNGQKLLVVPLQVESFTLWNQLSTSTGYIHVNSVADKITIQLHDATGQLIATMIGVEFVETTLNNILSMIESQWNPFPNMYKLLWRDELGPFEKRMCLKKSIFNQISSDEYNFNTFTPDEEIFYQKSNSLFGLYMLKSLINMGLTLCISNDIVYWPEIQTQLNVLPEHTKFLRYIFTEICNDGWLQIQKENENGSMELKVISQFPDLETLNFQIKEILDEINQNGIGEVDVNCVKPFGDNLSEILTGALSALPILFPEGTNKPGPAEQLYTKSFFAENSYKLNDHFIPSILQNISSCTTKSGDKSVARFLEIGAGTGALTKKIIHEIQRANKTSNFEYTYTDLSPIFLQKGEQLFSDTGIPAKFEILNIEENPMNQGFIPQHFEVIAAFYVLHATRDIEESVRNIVKLLKPGGVLILLELTGPSRFINLVFGGLNQFWRFSDNKLRPHNCEISLEKWKYVLEKYGFEDIILKPTFHSKNSMVLAKLSQNQTMPMHDFLMQPNWIIFGDDGKYTQEIMRTLTYRQMNPVLLTKKNIYDELNEDIGENIANSLNSIFKNNVQGIIYLWGLNNDKPYQEICEPYLHICKYLVNVTNTNLKLVVFTKGNVCVGPLDFNLSEPHPSPIISMTKSLSNENNYIHVKCVDIDPTLVEINLHEAIGEALTEIYIQDNENLVACRKNRRYVPRLSEYTPKKTGLPLPRYSKYRLILPTSNLISDLKFAAFVSKPLKEKDVEVQIKAYSLNFRDLMVVLKPDPVFENFNTIGLDYAGIVTSIGSKCTKFKVGDRVTGFRIRGDAMPSHVIVDEFYTLPLREDLTFCDGATLPAAFITVYICLIDLAKIKAGDVVLIHTASGGVGLAAVQTALETKCIVVATAGNEKKRNYLKNLGVKYVFNSRSTDYQQGIEKALNGRGVDVVLNSLTGIGFKEATLAVCAPNARFIEMSKMNIWSKEEVQKLRPDITYETVDLSQEPEKNFEKSLGNLNTLLNEKKESGYVLKPLPYTRFDCSEIRMALEHMEKAKHIGKIVINMTDTKRNTVELFNDNSTYMITGGLGGIGLEVADWMSKRGAKNILLVGRSPPKKEILERISNIAKSGVKIVIKQCDIGNYKECENLFNIIKKDSEFPSLRGIIHAAGVLSDEFYENQTWDKFETVFNAKIRGSWNLHQLTLSLKLPLEYFIMFSSCSAIICPNFQSNHSAGNYFMDSLAHYRSSLGLSATTINWGQWGQVGVAANLNMMIFKPFTLNQGLAVLEHTIQSHHTQIIPVEVNLSSIKKTFLSIEKLLSEINTSTVPNLTEFDSNLLWEEYDSVENRDEKCEIIKKHIKTSMRIALKLGSKEIINDHENFQEVGMDSLMIVELKNELQVLFGKRVKLSINSVRDCKTVQQLGERIVDIISGKAELVPPTHEELKSLILLDSILPDEINVALEIIPAQKISKCSIALITGGTGTLGSWILREVLKQTSIKKVYCLLRENKILSPKDRLVQVLKEKRLLQDIDVDKVTCVVGDVSQTHFGLDDEMYTKLCQETEIIFNLAVKSGHEEFYMDTTDPKHTRNVNLNGVKNTLIFASQVRVKHVYHATTMMAETQIDSDGHYWEDWPVVGELDHEALPNSAYYISKYVSDLLVAQAVQRGIPCKAFRFPDISDENNARPGNILMMRMMTYMSLGYMPARNIPISIMPVHLCARFSVSVFFNEEAGNEMYNVSNPYLGDEREFDEIAEGFGVSVDVLEPSEFTEKVKGFNGNDKIAQFAKATMTMREEDFENLAEYVSIPYLNWLAGDKETFVSKKLTKLIPAEYPSSIKPTWEVLKKELQNAKETGVFDKFGIRQTLNETDN